MGNSYHWSPAQWIALHRVLLLTQYMLRHFDNVPPHLAPQLHAQLLSPTFDGAPPVVAASAPLTNDSAQSLAQATVSFEPARGRLHLGSAVVCGVANHASLLSSEKRSAASRGAAASTAAAASGDVLVFSTSQLYELVQGAAGGAAAAGLLALTRRRAICAPEQLHAALCTLLDLLHGTPPRAAAAAAAAASSASTPPAQHYSAELLSALNAQAYHVTWRLLGALPATVSSTPLALPEIPSSGEGRCCTLQEVRTLLRVAHRGGGSESSAGSAARCCARMLASVAQDADFERVAALASALAFCLERIAVLPAASSEGEQSAATAAPEDDALTGMLTDLASATSSIATALKATAKTMLPAKLADKEFELAGAALACGFGGARVHELIAFLAGFPSASGEGAVAVKAVTSLGDPLALMRLETTNATSDKAATEAASGVQAAGGGSAEAAGEERLLGLLLTHLMAPLTVSALSSATSTSTSNAASGGGAAEAEERRTRSDKQRMEAAAAASVAVAVANAAATAAAATAAASRLAESGKSTRGEIRAAEEEEDEDEDAGEEDEHDAKEDDEDDGGGELMFERFDPVQVRVAEAAPEAKAADAVVMAEAGGSSAAEASASAADSAAAFRAAVAAKAAAAASPSPLAPQAAAQRRGVGETAVPHASLQLALHSLLRATLALLRGLSAASPDGEARLRKAGHALVHAVLPLQADPVFNFVRGGMRSLLTLLLPADAAQCYADLLSSRRYEAFLNLANAHLTESTAPSSTGGSIRLRKSELLVDLVGDCVDAIESMAKSSARQMNLVLYYSGVQQSASPRPPTASEEMDVDTEAEAELFEKEEEARTDLRLDGRQGDLSALISVLRGPASELSAKVIALLLRALALPSAAALSDTFPRLHSADGATLSASDVSLATRLTDAFLAMDEAALEAWLRSRLAAGPLGTKYVASATRGPCRHECSRRRQGRRRGGRAD